MLRRVTGSKPPRAYFVPLTATPHNPAATTSATAGRRSHGTGDGTAMRNTTTPPIAGWIDATVSRVVLSPNRERAPMFQARLPRFAGSRRSPSWAVKAAVEPRPGLRGRLLPRARSGQVRHIRAGGCPHVGGRILRHPGVAHRPGPHHGVAAGVDPPDRASGRILAAGPHRRGRARAVRPRPGPGPGAVEPAQLYLGKAPTCRLALRSRCLALRSTRPVCRSALR